MIPARIASRHLLNGISRHKYVLRGIVVDGSDATYVREDESSHLDAVSIYDD